MDNYEVIVVSDYEVELRSIHRPLVIEVNFENRHRDYEFISGLYDVKSIKITSLSLNGKLDIESLFHYLSVCYLEYNFIPKYKFLYGLNSKLGFEIVLGSLKKVDIKSLLFSIGKCLDVHKINLKINLNAVSPDYSLDILQTNTKSRRLGYLKLIILFFEESNYFPVNYLNKKIELESNKFIVDLEEYGNTNSGNSKGLIKATSSGISAKPYTDLLEEMNLLTRVSNSYILTKQAKVYFVLQARRKARVGLDNNLFVLDELDRLFFLRQIFSADSLYMIVLLDIIKIVGKVSTKTIKEVFQLYLLDELERVQHKANVSSFMRNASVIRKRIRDWLKPQVYLEHIVEPRVNWLLDLGLVIQDKGSKNTVYCLSIYGKKFLSIISSTLEIGESREIYTRKIINSQYFRIFDSVYHSGTKGKIHSFNEIQSMIADSFSIFKTNAPNRIAASQAIDYVSFKSYLETGKTIEFDEVKAMLEKNNGIVAMDWFNTESDGALYLKTIRNHGIE